MPTSTPIYRDFLAYQRLTIDQASTRQVAQELDISQTRVRQVVRRVTDWIAENAPPTSEADDAKKLRLAQQIAADRLENCLQQANAAWQKSHEVKYLGLLARLILAQSKILALPGTTEALLTDAILGPLEDTHPNSVEENETASGRHQPTEVVGLETETIPRPSTQFQPEIPSLSPIENPSIRACSPSPAQAPPAPSPAPHPVTASPTAHESLDDDDLEQRAARSAFFAPAHLRNAAGELSPVTELKMTPQKLTVHSGQRPNRHQRRRLQRLASKS